MDPHRHTGGGSAYLRPVYEGLFDRSSELGVLAALKLVDSTEATGEHTIVVHLRQSDPAIIDAFTGTAGMLVSPKAIDDPALDRNQVGRGPYVYDAGASREGEVRIYTPNPTYRTPDDQGLENLEIPDTRRA
ncbi:MAG: peptide/nickel transport system substrate-binding protein [Paracoccaceae bacterium]|jgi:peptide/nickel transport system substrate-binding protein